MTATQSFSWLQNDGHYVLHFEMAFRNVGIVKKEVDQTPWHWLATQKIGLLAAISGAALAVMLYLMASEQAQLLSLGIQISLLFVWIAYEPTNDFRALNLTSVTLQDLTPRDTSDQMTGHSRTLANLKVAVENADILIRDCVLSKVAEFDDEFHRLAAGRIVFQNTETWRTAYEKVLLAPGVTEYHSVSWVKTADYWQDRPGQQSIRLNYDLLDRGVGIERLVILGWNLWLPEQLLPDNSVRRWLEEQHYRGISLALVRESELVNEADLLRDFGIYGNRATGEQELDEQSRTVRFELRFDELGIRLAADRWERLKLYARRYTELLDRAAIGD